MSTENNVWANKEAQKEAMEQIALRIAELTKKVNDMIDRELESISSSVIIIEEGQDEIIERLTELENRFIKHEQILNLHNSNIEITDKFESEK